MTELQLVRAAVAGIVAIVAACVLSVAVGDAGVVAAALVVGLSTIVAGASSARRPR